MSKTTRGGGRARRFSRARKAYTEIAQVEERKARRGKEFRAIDEHTEPFDDTDWFDGRQRGEDMKRTKPPTCRHCGALVRAIEGRVLLPGNAPGWRHVDTPRGCAIGDPLMDRDVLNAPVEEGA